jgi:hypothetical protein
VKNSLLTKNVAIVDGGGAASSSLANCTLLENAFGSTSYGYGGGASYSTLTNCIVYANQPASSYNGASNYYNCTLTSSCSLPLAAGSGNIGVDPQILADGTHLADDSPCRGAGIASGATGVDIDGQPWSNPPSMGCDEWLPAPVAGGQLQATLTGTPPVCQVEGVVIAGQEPFVIAWLKDGAELADGPRYGSTHATNLTIGGFGPADAGAYQIVASNAYGAVTSAVLQVTVHCVDAAGRAPEPPYSGWASAATNIQDALDVAGAGEFVLVTNGLYASGGKVMAGDLLNRVALTRPLTLASINGAATTVIEGSWDPALTNGPSAVRCAWLADGCVLSGFTLRRGATRAAGDGGTLQSGGGIWANSTNAIVADCVVATNAANSFGGGCYHGLLRRCRVLGNRSSSGGGVCQATAFSSLILGNRAAQWGGGTYNGTLINCTVTENACGLSGGGISGDSGPPTPVRYFNCVISDNRDWSGYSDLTSNWDSQAGYLSFSCTYPQPYGGTSNITGGFLIDGLHLAVNSPCRGAGNPAYATGTDLEGNAWANPPSMGCFEVNEAEITGPLAVSITPVYSSAVEDKDFALFGNISGWASRVGWSFGDGTIITNLSLLAVGHTWTNSGDYTVTFTAFNTDHPDGVSTNLMLHVAPLVPPNITTGGLNGSSFSLSFMAQPGIQYVVEQATNLTPPVIWQTVATVYGQGKLAQVTDTGATNAARFYRARSQ